jgi:hypothetical protein
MKYLPTKEVIYFLRQFEFCMHDIVEELFADPKDQNWERMCFSIGRLSQFIDSKLDELEEYEEVYYENDKMVNPISNINDSDILHTKL